MKVNKMKKIMPPGSHNAEKFKISERYSVMFYTFQHYVVFRYYKDDGIDFSETNRGCVIWWISPEEKEKLLTFEDEKKNEFHGLETYGLPESEK